MSIRITTSTLKKLIQESVFKALKESRFKPQMVEIAQALYERFKKDGDEYEPTSGITPEAIHQTMSELGLDSNKLRVQNTRRAIAQNIVKLWADDGIFDGALDPEYDLTRGNVLRTIMMNLELASKEHSREEKLDIYGRD